MVALKIDDETNTSIHIFKKNIISTYYWVRFWGRTSTKCQFYKDTTNGNDLYLIFIDDNSMQWQIYSNLTEGKYGCPNKEKMNLLYYNHQRGEMIKSEGWLDYRKGKYYTSKINITVYDLDQCSAYKEDKIENKCTNDNPIHCEIVLRNGTNEAIQKCFENERTPRDYHSGHEKIGQKQGSPHGAIIGGIVGGLLLLLVLSMTSLICLKKKFRPEPGPEYDVSNFQRGEEKEIHQKIFMKKENPKVNVLNSTEDEKNIFEEFNKLETKTAACISLVKSTKTPQKEKNKKHNRYSDIGKKKSIL